MLVWAAPDIVMRVDHDGAWEVIDVKSGRLRDGRAFRAAVAQVTSYAVSLRHGAGVLQAAEGCRGRLILLGDGTEHEFAITANEIDAAEARIRAGALAMASLRAQADEAATAALEQAAALGLAERDVAAAVFAARRDAYPMTVDRTRCRQCPFLELCLPEMGVAAVAERSTEEVA